MYADIADKIKEIIDGLAGGLGLRTVAFWGRSGLEGLASEAGGLPGVLIMFARSEPGARASGGIVRTESYQFRLLVAVSDFFSFGSGQTGASDILSALRGAFNPRDEIVNGVKVRFIYNGSEIVAVDSEVLVYGLDIEAMQL